MKNIVLAALFVVFGLAVTESKAETAITNQTLAGTWVKEGGNSSQAANTIVFNLDGTVKWHGNDFRYEVVTEKSINMTKFVLHNAKNERFETDGIILSQDGKMLIMWDSGMMEEIIYTKK